MNCFIVLIFKDGNYTYRNIFNDGRENPTKIGQIIGVMAPPYDPGNRNALTHQSELDVAQSIYAYCTSPAHQNEACSTKMYNGNLGNPAGKYSHKEYLIFPKHKTEDIRFESC